MALCLTGGIFISGYEYVCADPGKKKSKKTDITAECDFHPELTVYKCKSSNVSAGELANKITALVNHVIDNFIVDATAAENLAIHLFNKWHFITEEEKILIQKGGRAIDGINIFTHARTKKKEKRGKSLPLQVCSFLTGIFGI
jgi:hypothetical protein